MKRHLALMGCFIATVATLACTTYLQAQERTAAGTVENQMTWTALTGVAKAAGDKADAVNARVDQSVVCGKKGRVYAPGVAGADAQGCAMAAVDFTALINRLNSLESSDANVKHCGAAGMTFSGSGCVATQKAPTFTGCYDKQGWWGVHVTCNPGEVVTKVCSSGRDADCPSSEGLTFTVLTCCRLQ